MKLLQVCNINIVKFVIVIFSADRTNTPLQQKQSIEQFCLMLPGKVLDLSQLLIARKRGNKQGALTAFKMLEADELGNHDILAQYAFRERFHSI